MNVKTFLQYQHLQTVYKTVDIIIVSINMSSYYHQRHQLSVIITLKVLTVHHEGDPNASRI